MGKVKLSMLDYSGEESTVATWIDDYTAANFTAHNTEVGQLRTAIEGVSLANTYKDERVVSITTAAKLNATATEAQREIKWLVRCTVAAGAGAGLPVNFEIPCADTSLLVPNTDLMDLTAGAGATLVGAIEGTVRSNRGEAVVVQEIVLVGRTI